MQHTSTPYRCIVITSIPIFTAVANTIQTEDVPLAERLAFECLAAETAMKTVNWCAIATGAQKPLTQSPLPPLCERMLKQFEDVFPAP